MPSPVHIIGIPPDVEPNTRPYWETRYRQGDGPVGETPHEWLVQATWRLPRRGRALDIACGMGRDTIWLARWGLCVHGVDFAATALAEARRRAARAGVLERTAFIQADLTRFYFPPRYYDVIIGFSYWERDILPEVRDAVKPGGFIVYETLNIYWKHTRPDVDERFLLQPGELLEWLQGWRIWAYREVGNDGHLGGGKKAISSIVAQRV